MKVVVGHVKPLKLALTQSQNKKTKCVAFSLSLAPVANPSAFCPPCAHLGHLMWTKVTARSGTEREIQDQEETHLVPGFVY